MFLILRLDRETRDLLNLSEYMERHGMMFGMNYEGANNLSLDFFELELEWREL